MRRAGQDKHILRVKAMKAIVFVTILPVAVLCSWVEVAYDSVKPFDPSWQQEYDTRVQQILESKDWQPPGGSAGAECSDSYFDLDQGKYTWPALLSGMFKVKNDTAALQAFISRNASYDSLGANGWLDTKKCGTLRKPFNAVNLATYFAVVKDRLKLLPGNQTSRLRFMMAREGWGSAARLPGHLDEIWYVSEFDSENYLHMARSAGLIFAEQLPEAAGVPGGADPYQYGPLREFLANAARAWLHAGRLEWDSQNYIAFNVQPALLLFEYSNSPEVRRQARALLDWLFLTSALKHMDGWQIGPDARAKDIAADPFSGSAWAMHWLYLTDARHRPSFPASEAVSRFSLTLLAQFPWTSYRPPQQALDLVERRYETPVLMRNAKPFYRIDAGDYRDWAGAGDGRRFEFETLYLERNYTLGSVAAGRPNGLYNWQQPGLYGQGQLCFSEQSVWRLGVRGSSDPREGLSVGGKQVFGNSGLPDLSGRSPWEQLAQGRSQLLRVVSGTDSMWTAFPNGTTDPQLVDFPAGGEGGAQAAFQDLGSGVFVGVLPFQSQGKPEVGAYHRPQAAASQLTWAFRNESLGALALVVGTAGVHGSLAGFQQAVLQGCKFDLVQPSPGAGRGGTLALECPSEVVGGRGGDHVSRLQLRHTGLDSSYRMVDGQAVVPAGGLPEVEFEGQPVDFASFDSYGVVEGAPVLEQGWGGPGNLTVRTEAGGYRVRVDGVSGEATFYEDNVD